MTFKYRAEFVYEPPRTSKKKRQRLSVLVDSDDASSTEDIHKRGERELATYVSNPSTWDRSYFRIEYADPPWRQSGKPMLEDTLKNMDGVKWARYEAPMDGAYRAPRYHLGVVSGEETAVVKRIHEYYEGLVVSDSDGGDITVIISSLEALSV